MLELFLSSLEDQLGLIVNPPLAPIARMGIISEEITRITSGGLTPLAPDAACTCAADGDLLKTDIACPVHGAEAQRG